MGLAIQYSLKSRVKSFERARGIVALIHNAAHDLPFKRVGGLVYLEGDECKRHALSGLLLQAEASVAYPWANSISRRIPPSELVAFSIDPGDGCESMSVGLCRYPATVSLPYKAREDRQFFYRKKPEFYFFKWQRWADKHAPESDCNDVVDREVKTRLGGWRWSSFCKTQYASDPSCGGLANFLRCHIGVVTLLEQAGTFPGLQVWINDEGHYGPYGPMSSRAHPVDYHRGTYSVATLIRQVGDYNQLVAACAGSLRDGLGDSLESPIFGYKNFEQLEFKGSQDPEVTSFLTALKAGIGSPGKVTQTVEEPDDFLE